MAWSPLPLKMWCRLVIRRRLLERNQLLTRKLEEDVGGDRGSKHTGLFGDLPLPLVKFIMMIDEKAAFLEFSRDADLLYQVSWS